MASTSHKNKMWLKENLRACKVKIFNNYFRIIQTVGVSALLKVELYYVILFKDLQISTSFIWD